MPESQVIYDLVQSQFGPVADQYTTSHSHDNPVELARLVALAQPRPSDRVLDVATGAGHTALAFAPHVAEVIAYDLTAAMLDEVNRNATQRGLHNVRTLQGPAESLPFPDDSFEIVAVRIAPHHFADVQRAVREMSRVVKPGGPVLVVDTTVPDDDLLDQQINTIEKLRDPSHVRNYRESEWRAMLEAAGLTVIVSEIGMCPEGSPLSFENWTARMRTPAEAVAELEGLFHEASPALRSALDIRIVDGRISFRLPRMTLVARKAGSVG